ncbi:MAG: sel1 repeat family protein [Myxococcales bacterium]|nr:sel1 repeat family protein [Myxococcales bacterium]
MSGKVLFGIFGILLATACGPAAVELRPAKTCDGGNLEDCRTRCEANEGRACYRLGWFYEEDQEVKGSMSQAVDLYHRACSANFAVACRSLGMIHWEGKGVKRNFVKAIEYFKLACELGLPEACPDQDMLRIASGNRARGSASGDASFSVSVGVDEPRGPDAPDAPAVNTPDAPKAETPSLSVP